MNPFRYILRRLLFGALVLVAVITVTFVLSRSLGGNTVVAWLGKSASIHPELAALYAKKYHLNDPIPVQYYYYILNLIQGNLGFSPSRGFQPVAEVISITLPFTIQIAFFAFVISLALGIGLGVLSAKYQHRPLDTCIRAFYLGGYSSPPFFIALILLIVFAFTFRILPSGGAFDLALTPPTAITGVPMVDAAIEGNGPYFLSSLQHVILPSVSLALVTFGVLTRVLRSSMLDVMHSNYIRTARAKGLDENTVFFKHALKEHDDISSNDLLPDGNLADNGNDIRREHLWLPGDGTIPGYRIIGRRLPWDIGSYNSIRCGHSSHESNRRHPICSR